MTGARYHSMQELLTLFPNNATILEAVIKTEDHINTVARNGGKIMVSVSGGSELRGALLPRTQNLHSEAGYGCVDKIKRKGDRVA